MKKNINDTSNQLADSELTNSIKRDNFNPNNPLESEGRGKRSQHNAKQRLISLAPQSKLKSKILQRNNPDGSIMEKNN